MENDENSFDDDLTLLKNADYVASSLINKANNNEESEVRNQHFYIIIITSE